MEGNRRRVARIITAVGLALIAIGVAHNAFGRQSNYKIGRAHV